MKLIKISEDEIYDMDTTTAYKLKSNNRYQKDGTPVESIEAYNYHFRGFQGYLLLSPGIIESMGISRRKR